MSLPRPWVINPDGSIDPPSVQENLEYLDESIGLTKQVQFLNGWTTMGGYAPPTLQLVNGRMFFSGVVDGNGAATFNAMQLPADLCPLTTAIVRFPTSYWSGANLLGSMDISSGTRGLVRLFNNADAFGAIRYVAFSVSWAVP